MGQQPSKPRPPPQPTPAPGPVYYKVDNGNWTGSVIDSGGAEGWWSDYTINFDHQGDPAYGCQKEFVSEYKCAVSTNKTKTADASKEAYGKTVVYDCDTEYNIANANRLYVLDNGNVIIKNDYTGNMLWQSNTNKVGLPTDAFKAENSRFGRNYLKAGETLFPGDFIGSPSGNCYLAIFYVSPGVTELRLVYSQAAVGPEGTPKPGENLFGQMGDIGNTQLDGGSYAAYKVINFNGEPQSTGAHGKNLYIDFNLNKQIIPNSMITGLNNQYTYVGNFSQDGRHQIGTVGGSNPADCQNSCNKNDNCWGFVYNEESKSCSLKSSDMFPNDMLRKLDNNSKMYVRGMKVNSDNSCSKNSTVVYQDVYEKMPNGATMTPQTACNLRSVTREQRAIVKEKQDNLMKVAKKVKMHASDLKQKNTALAAKLVEQLEKYQNAIGDYTGVKHEIEVEQDNYQQVNAMASSSETEMISNNYQYLAFTGLAALGVVAAIKATN